MSAIDADHVLGDGADAVFHVGGGFAMGGAADGACAQAVDTIVRELGRLDVAVANAGFGVAGKITELDVAAWKRQFDVNVFGLVATLQAAVPALRETDGRVALLGSVMAMVTTRPASSAPRATPEAS